ncbi:MAG: aldo/keto reductase [Candidatus Atribacteria bacterium]|nr:aldo/keto reductase [Candidatus Atribacteria bacterium]
MRYLNLGKSGLLVSEVSLGTMTFGREASEEESVRMLNLYLERGGNFVDTANVYAEGRSEEILGRALRGKRHEVVLATKGFFRMGEGLYDHGANRKHLLRALEESLKRLQTDYVDLYQIHCFDELTPLEETLETLDLMVRQGKVLYVGLSNYTGWQIARAIGIAEQYGFPRFVSAQMEYSLVERNIELEVVPACRALSLSIMAWGPLGGGFLSGKYKAGEFPKEGRLSVAKEEWEEHWSKRATEKNFRVLAVLEELAQKYQKTVPQVALNWLLQKENVIPILGATKYGQLADNLGCVGWSLAKEDVTHLDSVSAPDMPYPYRFITWANKLVRGEA